MRIRGFDAGSVSTRERWRTKTDQNGDQNGDSPHFRHFRKRGLSPFSR